MATTTTASTGAPVPSRAIAGWYGRSSVEQLVRHKVEAAMMSWDDFERQLPSLGEPYFFSTKASRLFWDAPLGTAENVVLIFGCETGGLPTQLHERFPDRFLRMPIFSPLVRSLNLSTSVALAVYEVLRQRAHLR